MQTKFDGLDVAHNMQAAAGGIVRRHGGCCIRGHDLGNRAPRDPGVTAVAGLIMRVNRGTIKAGNMTAVKRIVPERCCAVIVDLQRFFLSQIDPPLRARLTANTANLIRLLGAFRVPVMATVERPLDRKGTLPKEVARRLAPDAKVLEKSCFDLTKERKIKAHLARQKRRQVIVTGCETDVCVMQSCLGLVALGYEVYVMEELIFSSTGAVGAALARMKDAGCVFLTYKMLYYELLESVEGPGGSLEDFDLLPDDLPDAAV